MKRKRLVFYVSVGLIAYGVFLISQAPAAFLFDQARRYQPGLQTEQLSGTLWRGSAQALRLAPEPANAQRLSRPLNLNWRWHPLRLFSGLLGFQVHAAGAELELTAAVAIDRKRQLSFSALDGTISVRRAADLSRLSALMASAALDGQLAFNGMDVGIDEQGRIVSANGELSLRDIQLTLGDNLHLGDYTARWITKAQLVEAEITDQGGPVELTGVLQLTAEGDYSYRCSGQLGLREGAASAVRQALALLGRPAADGKWRFNFSGAITPGTIAPATVK